MTRPPGKRKTRKAREWTICLTGRMVLRKNQVAMHMGHPKSVVKVREVVQK